MSRKCQNKMFYHPFRGVFILLSVVGCVCFVYSIITIFSNDYSLSGEYRYFCSSRSSPNLTISLSSIPPRFDKTRDRLQQLSQFPCVKTIYLNVPLKYRRGFKYAESDMERLKVSSKVQIHRVDHDFGPATKILGLFSLPLDVELEQQIVYLDDDVEYKNLCDIPSPAYKEIVGSIGKNYNVNGVDQTKYSDTIKSPFSLPCMNPLSDVLWAIGAISMSRQTFLYLRNYLELFKHVFSTIPSECVNLDDNVLSFVYQFLHIKLFSIRNLQVIQNETQSANDGLSVSGPHWNRQFYCYQFLTKGLHKL
jgi:hypothetical protein